MTRRAESIRIQVLSPIPTPYRDPLWATLASLRGVELQALYCARGKADRPWKASGQANLDQRFLRGLNLLAWRGRSASLFWNPGTTASLSRFAPQVVVIVGYNHLSMLMAMIWCRRRRVPYVLLCETHRQDDGTGLRAWLRRRLLRWVLGGAGGALPTGRLAHAFIRARSRDTLPTESIPNVPDVAALMPLAEKRADGQLGSEDGRSVLFVGRFVEQKQIRDLLHAFAALDEKIRGSSRLELVGDGVQRPALEQLARDLGIAAQVRFCGFLDPAAVVDKYRSADVFVLPSAETWSVAAVEAVAAGLVTILSDRVGAATDLRDELRLEAVKVFRHGDRAGLAALLGSALRAGRQRLPADGREDKLADWCYAPLARRARAFLVRVALEDDRRRCTQ